ncbi:MAG: mechanosensitive ion channel [Legionellaceae bacterium]|nr:mechanosensitive ion channel [Legionellaceae bacterium]
MRASLWFGLFFFMATISQAMPIDTYQTTFDLKNANQTFDKINLKLSTQNLNRKDLDAAVDVLTALNDQAEYCINDTQKKINNLSTLITPNNQANNTNSVDLIYLNNQKKELANTQAQCNLFSIRAKEAIDAYRTVSAQFAQREALIKDTPLWLAIKQIHYANHHEVIGSIQKIFAQVVPPYWMNTSFACFALFTALFLFLKLQKSRFVHHFSHYKVLCFSHIFLLSTSLYTGAFFIYQLNVQEDTSSALMVPAILFGYLLSLTGITLLFKMKLIKSYCLSYALDSNFFKNLLLISVSLSTMGLIGEQISLQINASDTLWQLCQSLYLFITLGIAAYFVHYFCAKHCHYLFVQTHQRSIYGITSLWVLTDLLIDIQGYHHLAMRIIVVALTTLTIICITTLLVLETHKIYLTLHQKPSFQKWITRYIGYKADQTFTELFILKLMVQSLIVSLGIYCIGHSMDFTTYYTDSLYEQIMNGIHFASIIIFPMRILAGVVTFCLLFLVFRGIATFIVRHHQLEDEEETQVALASIATYFGFMLALLAGLIIAGFNFTGLAIVAGALSVGIGLGLQSIVNNFVSGLILLIEKPIQPGDRINVDGVEGFVKKIRVRSTHIITPNREDIIIPNADLISHRVTNYMFSDKNCRITCEVEVTYGSDTNLVREVLLNIANLHDDVIKTGASKPFVLFRSFGANNFVFQLSCLIHDVNRKGIVQSDLNYAIEENFRKNNIFMPT